MHSLFLGLLLIAQIQYQTWTKVVKKNPSASYRTLQFTKVKKNCSDLLNKQPSSFQSICPYKLEPQKKCLTQKAVLPDLFSVTH